MTALRKTIATESFASEQLHEGLETGLFPSGSAPSFEGQNTGLFPSGSAPTTQSSIIDGTLTELFPSGS